MKKNEIKLFNFSLSKNLLINHFSFEKEVKYQIIRINEVVPRIINEKVDNLILNGTRKFIPQI